MDVGVGPVFNPAGVEARVGSLTTTVPLGTWIVRVPPGSRTTVDLPGTVTTLVPEGARTRLVTVTGSAAATGCIACASSTPNVPPTSRNTSVQPAIACEGSSH